MAAGIRAAGILAGFFLLLPWGLVGLPGQGRRGARGLGREPVLRVLGEENRFFRRWIAFGMDGFPWRVYVEDVKSPFPLEVAKEAFRALAGLKGWLSRRFPWLWEKLGGVKGKTMKVFYFSSSSAFHSSWRIFTRGMKPAPRPIRTVGRGGVYWRAKRLAFLWTAGKSRYADTKADCLYWCARQALDTAGLELPPWLEEGLARYLSSYVVRPEPGGYRRKVVPGKISMFWVKQIKGGVLDLPGERKGPVLPFSALLRSPFPESVGKDQEKWREAWAFCAESWGLVYLGLEGTGSGKKDDPALAAFRRAMGIFLSRPMAGRERLLGIAYSPKKAARLEVVFRRFFGGGAAEERASALERESRRIMMGQVPVGGKPVR